MNEKVIFEGGHPWEHHPRCLRCLMEVGLRRDSPGMFHMQTKTQTKTKTKTRTTTKTSKTTKNSIVTEFQSISLFFVKVWQNCADVNILPKAMWLSLYLHYHGSIIVHIEGKKNRFFENKKNLLNFFLKNHLFFSFRVSDTQWPSNRKLPRLEGKLWGDPPPSLKRFSTAIPSKYKKKRFWNVWICTQ